MSETFDPQFTGPSSVPASFNLPLPVRMTFGQILDRIYQLTRNNWRLFFGIAAVPSVAMLAIMAAMMGMMATTLLPQITGKSQSPGAVAGVSPWLGVIILIAYPIMFLVFGLYMAAASFAATQTDLEVEVSFSQAYGVARKHLGRYLWLMILGLLIVMIPIAVIAAIVFGGAALVTGIKSNPASAFFLVPLVLIFDLGILVYSILVMLRLAVSYPACVEEGLTAWGAVRRSVRLTHGAQGRIFLVMLVVYAAAYAVTLVIVVVLFALGALVALAAVSAHVTVGSPAFIVLVGLGVLIYLLVTVACTLFSYSALTTAIAVLYHDQRLRKDGLEPTLHLA